MAGLNKGCHSDKEKVAQMAIPQRDDPPSRCALRRISTIEAIERLGASLEYVVMHDDEEEAECIREELRRLTDEV